ncbi:MAG: tRNA (adenosine(37)-N6)-threonylcarbamoyltransferase complex dimerization subunit type 1 TsaB [Phycisphaerales bacterium]|jgi:tRNA threonylcarbamoyladenosine biosynthesis protein TsaB|nr:tRNA (adenosine(37)-N6)-threonylcarbamoyltransferase complex dimerization subunit type 1 TsaB [Phycisphaerales bacterium]
MNPEQEQLVVAIELSQQEGSVAAKNGESAIVEKSVAQRVREKDTFLPAIQDVVSDVGGDPKEITAVIVSSGPGSFTGLRVSIAAAKMIAISTGATVVSIPSSINVVASDENHGTQSLVVSAHKNDTSWVSVVNHSDRWSCDGTVISNKELARMVDTHTVLYGDEFLSDALKQCCVNNAIEIRPHHASATTLLTVGLQWLRLGITTDPAQLLPIYPREPEAVRLWKERKHR